MELNRNQYLMIGLVVLFLGIQFRLVHSVVLNGPTSEFVAKRMKQETSGVQAYATALFATPPPASRRVVEPPRWIGWVLVSVGSVLILHSLAMPKPGGG